MTQTSPLRFSDLNLIEPLLRALQAEGYEHPTPIQQQAIPHVLAQRDLLGVAQTGTGKTAAFALPILQLLAAEKTPAAGTRPIRTLILTPTRELAAQIGESFDRYGANLGLRGTVIFGGVGQGTQTSALRNGIDILVATPGRLLDLMEQRFVDLTHIEIFVLDEADRMLDMGFIHDVRRILKALPKKRHSLFFSATMPPDIQRLAHDILTNPTKVEVTPIATTAEKIDQSVYLVGKHDKRHLLVTLLENPEIARVLVFTRTKHGADKVTRFLNQSQISAEAIHGNKSQNNRVRALANFKEGNVRVLVATDIAARGIDIDGITHVINYELPNIPESYVHRIGRTARAGAEGIAISFCDAEERAYLKDIEKLIRMQVRTVEMPFAPRVASDNPPEAPRARPPHPNRGGGQRSGPRPGHRPSSEGARTSSGGRPASGPRQGSAATPTRTRSTGASATGGAREGGRRPEGRSPAQGARGPRGGTSAGGGARRSGPSSGTRSTGSGGQRPDARRGGHGGPASASNASSARSSSSSSSSRPASGSAGNAPGAKTPWWKKIFPKDSE